MVMAIVWVSYGAPSQYELNWFEVNVQVDTLGYSLRIKEY